MGKKFIIANFLKLLKKTLIFLGISVTVLTLISLSIKGNTSKPLYFQNELDSKLEGPFESSGSNSRYALTKSIIDYKSLFLNTQLAKFSSPDLVVFNGKYITLFTPGVSFAAVPFYYIGKLIGLPQLITFLSGSVYAVINIFLIYLISRKVGSSKIYSMISGLVFAFATSALAYSNTLTQHHLSTLLVLAGVLNALGKRNLVNNTVFGLLVGLGALVDIPNVFMMTPAGIYVLSRHFSVNEESKKLKLKINLALIAVLIGLIPLAGLFAWYNKITTGSPTTLAQSIGRTDFFATADIKEVNKQQIAKAGEFQPVIPFSTRIQLNGFYILLISNERGIFYYNPIVIFGILGLILAYRNRINNDLVVLLSTTVLVNVLIYSMFGDPWGGWSFGPRYLIPATALLCTGIGFSLTKLGRNPLFAAAFIAVLIYSVGVNVLGSTTTNLVPPRVEAENLAKPIPYTYQYNYQLAEENKSGILIYNLFLKNLINVKTYIYFYSTLIVTFVISLYVAGLVFKERKDNG